MFYKSLFAFTSLILVSSCAKKEVELSSREFSTVSMDYIDPNVKPQDDFFLFSNGNWIKNNEIPASESRWGSFNELDQENKKKLTAILEDAQANQGVKGSQNQLLGSYYASFMNMERRNQMGLSGIKSELNRIDSINRKDFIVIAVAMNHRDGIGSTFSFGVGQDMKNVTKNAAYIGQGGIGLPNKEYYTSANKAEILVKYQKHISNIFQLLGIPAEMADKKAASVVQFETKLASSMMAPAELRIPEKTYNLMSRQDVFTSFGKFNFDQYLSTVGSQSVETIVVSQPDFIVKVKTRDGTMKTLMIEVKPKKQTIPPEPRKRVTKQYVTEVTTYGVNQAKWKAAHEYCLDRGWEFKIMTEEHLGL